MKVYKAHQLIKKLNSLLGLPNGTFIKTYDIFRNKTTFEKEYIHELIIFNDIIYDYEEYSRKGSCAHSVLSSLLTWQTLRFEIQPYKIFTKEQAERQFDIVIKDVIE